MTELNGIVNHLISTKKLTNNRWLIDLKKLIDEGTPIGNKF